MFPTLKKIGNHFRKSILGTADVHPCAICLEETLNHDRRWSPSRRAYIHVECIPAYIRHLGDHAVVRWLNGESFR